MDALADRCDRREMHLIEVPRAEFATRFHGWREPRELSEEFGPDVRGINPFTKQEVFVLGRRLPIGPEPIAAPDAIDSPRIADLRRLAVPEPIFDESFDHLAMVVFGWTARYAAGEIFGRFLEGGEDRSDYFQLVPRRVVDAVAAIDDEAIAPTARAWGEAADLELEVTCGWLPTLVRWLREAKADSLVLLWGTR
jgi:hypothetical protein